MRNLALVTLLLVLCGCQSFVDQRKLEPVRSGEVIYIASPVRIIEQRGLMKLEWQLLPANYVERYSISSGRVFLSDGYTVQFTSSLGEKTLNPGGFIVLKDKPGYGMLYIVRGKGAEVDQKSLLVILAAGVEGDLTLVTEFRLSEIKRR